VTRHAWTSLDVTVVADPNPGQHSISRTSKQAEFEINEICFSVRFLCNSFNNIKKQIYIFNNIKVDFIQY